MSNVPSYNPDPDPRTAVAAVTVVVPAYNCARFVAEALDSLFAQTVRPAQVVVVDDGSTDDTAERVAAYADRVEYVRQHNQGVSAARNRGLQMARGEFVAFLDADDVWHPRKLELQLDVLKSRPAINLLGTLAYDWPAHVPPPLLGEPRVAGVSWHQLVVKNRLVTSSVIVRRRCLSRVGPFDTGMQGPEDRDLWIRIAETCDGVANLEFPLTGYRAVAGSVSRQAARCQAGMRRIIQKLDDRRAWRGRWALRRKALSYIDNACACIYASGGHHWQAVWLLLRSFVWYPLPYGRGEADVPFERPKRLAVNLLRVVGLKAPEAPQGQPQDGAPPRPPGEPLAHRTPTDGGRAYV